MLIWLKAVKKNTRSQPVAKMKVGHVWEWCGVVKQLFKARGEEIQGTTTNHGWNPKFSQI